MRDRRVHPLIAALPAALALLAAAAGPARAEQAPRVGVVVSVKVNLEEREVQELSAALGRALHQKLVVDVVAGAEAARRLPAAGVSESCVVDPACIKDTAQRLGADEILFLVAVRVGNRVQVDGTWVDAASGRSASRPKVVMVKLEEAETRFADSASLILPDAEVRQTQVVPEPRAQATILVRTTPRHMTTGAWVAGGVSLAALGTAVGFTISTANRFGDCKDERDVEPCTSSQREKIRRRAITADLLWGLSIASAATSLVLYYTSGGEIERIPVAARAVRLHVDGGAAFLSVGGEL